MKKILTGFIFLVSLFVLTNSLRAQTSAFVYQGKLQDGGAAANGTYQFQFKLYDAASGGSQVGQTIADLPATVTNGIFAVQLNFGAGSFDAAQLRYLEISVRLNGSGQPYTTLAPRQQITSTPYAIRALNAQTAETALVAANSENLGGVPAVQYVVTNDPRLSDDRSPLPGSPNYIQNSANQQAAANFNISGEGKALKLTSVMVNATSEYQQGGARVMQFNAQKSGTVGLFAGVNSTGADNMFVGYEAGKDNSTGSFNAFFGSQSGKSNTTGLNNSFFGAYAGATTTTGGNNAFFGANAGLTNTTGATNSFFGANAGITNTSGSNNSLFGNLAGSSITIAGNNAMFGARAGEHATSGGNAFFGAFAGQKTNAGFSNVFLGMNAGKENLSGSENVYIGFNAGGTNQTGSKNVALGAGASLGSGVSNSIALGAGAQALQSNTFFVGGGVSKTVLDTDVTANGVFLNNGDGKFTGNLQSAGLSVGSGGLSVGGAATFNGGATFGAGINAQTIAASGNGLFQGSVRGDTLGMKQLWNGGSAQICAVDSAGYKYIANCSSSRRYKDEIESYAGGLEVLRKMRPVTFRWKSSGQKDVGFVAEEINEAEPLLNNYNEKGEVEGVKYAQVTTVLVNAVKEQQAQIERLEEQLRRQNEQTELLKTMVCSLHPQSAICTEKPSPESKNPPSEKEPK